LWQPSFTYCGDMYCENMVVADRQGGNGQPFLSAKDPRVLSVAVGLSIINPADSVFFNAKYTTNTTPIVVASGVEARLIEAEAALQAGDPSWFATLNTLRATAISPAMPTLAVIPSTKTAQVDLLYTERAFWLYLTGHRLGDLRRLIRNYGRDAEAVFPTGNYPLGGTYQPATAIPFILSTERAQNPYLTTGCTMR